MIPVCSVSVFCFLYLVECDKDKGLAKYAEVHFIHAAVFVSEQNKEENLREEGQNVQPNIIVPHCQV